MLTLQSETFTYTDRDGTVVTMTVTESNIERGIRRIRYREEMQAYIQKKMDEHTPLSADAAYALNIVYPMLLAGVTKCEGITFPPTPEEFLEYPERFWDAWSDVVRRMNPQWFPKAPEPKTDDAKKALSGEQTASTSA